MSYRAEHYNAVFEEMKSRFGQPWYDSIDWPMWGRIWRKQIKNLFFDQGILIREMVAGLDEAAEKRKWPTGTAFFVRLRDVCLKNRLERQRHGTMHVDGMKRLG